MDALGQGAVKHIPCICSRVTSPRRDDASSSTHDRSPCRNPSAARSRSPNRRRSAPRLSSCEASPCRFCAAIRTITLLRYRSEPALREQITMVANRTENFHPLPAHLMIGGQLISHNDPEHQERVVKLNELISDCAICSTALDIAAAAHQAFERGGGMGQRVIATTG
ncbi:Tn3 family transposase [Actinocrinis puniceicyclus]|uniref:Tn3 family transposase n=1 Tax=Actinocrinis puniceicyclus TaxID=977794 RepID=A0A8J7WSY6_9ACTN|nr:Tn3 family transposase [Actinocrinis puniceicyclus]